MLISLHSGGLSHLEMVFSPSSFPPTQQWLRERSQALFEPPYLCIQVHLCFWFVNSFLTRSFPVVNPFSNMWHAGRKMGNFLWYMQMTCSLNTSQWLRIPQSKALTATFTSAKYECQFWTLSSTVRWDTYSNNTDLSLPCTWKCFPAQVCKSKLFHSRKGKLMSQGY